jgi:hypothetical protein
MTMLISDIAIDEKDEQISVLVERIEILEEIIDNYEKIDTITGEIRAKNIVLASYDQELIDWIEQNMWITKVEWGD